MKVIVVAVGRPRGPLAEAITDYEARAKRYFTFSSSEVREEAAGTPADRIRVQDREGKRLLERAPAGTVLLALHRGGQAWSSTELAGYLAGLAVQGSPGAAFAIGGAFGLGNEVLERSAHRVSLSAFTMPHDLARLVLTEQLYRAGTINRGEPYHKGPAT